MNKYFKAAKGLKTKVISGKGGNVPHGKIKSAVPAALKHPTGVQHLPGVKKPDLLKSNTLPSAMMRGRC